MSDNAALVCIAALILGSCTADSAVHAIAKRNSDPVTECVRQSWNHADRIACLQAREKPHG